MKLVGIFYEYMLDWAKGSKRNHLDGERRFVERYVRPDEFDVVLGGKMLSIDPRDESKFIGVWGRQAISRFKRILRKRGAEFVIRHADGDDRVVKSYPQYHDNSTSKSSQCQSGAQPV